MLNWIESPKSPKVCQYIECYWLIEKDAQSDSYQHPKLNPDPCAHLIISPENQSYLYQIDAIDHKGIGCHWLFPHQYTFQLDHSEPFIHLGVKFRVGAIYSLELENCPHTMIDAVKDVCLSTLLNDIGVSGDELTQLGRSDPSLCRDKLDRLFSIWLSNCKEDQHSKLTRKSLLLLDIMPISDIGNKLGCSQRTLERSFTRVVGLTLKQCQSMNKLEAILEYLYQRETIDIDWAEVAIQFGFSDQPHLIRQLKKQIGVTPQNYAKNRGLTIDVYGGVN
ncbi:helix-turn-helix domain-containing protein [Marinomonas sp. ef1]|uniref:helix-turn-helix domain-containing protein n=1 Tax=Marinomonas sp. ef1 TaxID=2005043 RepID=UPI000C287ABA|nr:AraC family transcriptional regulator [Marinomonas sp. ef1]